MSSGREEVCHEVAAHLLEVLPVGWHSYQLVKRQTHTVQLGQEVQVSCTLQLLSPARQQQTPLALAPALQVWALPENPGGDEPSRGLLQPCVV